MAPDAMSSHVFCSSSFLPPAAPGDHVLYTHFTDKPITETQQIGNLSKVLLRFGPCSLGLTLCCTATPSYLSISPACMCPGHLYQGAEFSLGAETQNEWTRVESQGTTAGRTQSQEPSSALHCTEQEGRDSPLQGENILSVHPVRI